MATLYRPVGLKELALLWDSGLREFPPRLPDQPYFYPVTNYEYARQIARDWNVKDAASVFSGFVTRFEVADSHLSRYRPHVVGSSVHEEYWIPARELTQFNQAIVGRIVVEAAFFGANFEGYVPARGALKEKPALEQFIELAKIWDFNSVEFTSEVSINRKAIYLNAWFWAQQDCSRRGIRMEQKRLIFERMQYAWQNNEIQIPWPTEELNRALSLTGSTDQPAPGRWRNAMSRAGGRVDNAEIEERLAVQGDFRKVVQAEITKRPKGVSLVAIGMFLWAAVYLGVVILAIARPALLRTGDPQRDTHAAFVASFLLPARIALYVVLGVGLWNLRRWARRYVMLWSAVVILLNLLSWRGLSTVKATEIVLCIACIGYLSSKKVNAAFETSIQPKP